RGCVRDWAERAPGRPKVEGWTVASHAGGRADPTARRRVARGQRRATPPALREVVVGSALHAHTGVRPSHEVQTRPPRHEVIDTRIDLTFIRESRVNTRRRPTGART